MVLPLPPTLDLHPGAPFPSPHPFCGGTEMRSLRSLAQPVRDFVVARLETLHLALQQLAVRLCEGIATLIGSHVGNAIGDVLRAALSSRMPDADDEDTDDYHGDRSRYGQHSYERRLPSWHDPQPNERWYGPDRNTPPKAV